MAETSPKINSALRLVCDSILLFFGSSIFFIMLGIGFLYAVLRLMDTTHPSLIFLLAILGVSIVLYGTGTQGVGSTDGTKFPIKVVVAGGAGVLAAIFGYGVAKYGKDIKDVFNVHHQYARVVLNLHEDNEPIDERLRDIGDLRKLYISANLRDSGRPLHLLAHEDRIEVLVPITYFPDRTVVCVTILVPPNKSITGRPNCPPLRWSKNDRRLDNDLITHVASARPC